MARVRQLTEREKIGADTYVLRSENSKEGVDYTKRLTPTKYNVALRDLVDYRKRLISVYDLIETVPFVSLLYIGTFPVEVVHRELNPKYFKKREAF